MLPANFAPKIYRFDSLDSTNSKIKELGAQGLAEGSIVVAQSQTKGRGRGAHLWHSPPGGLYLSVLLYPNEPKRITDLSIVVGIAVAQTVKDLLPKAMDVSLKWPNDCLINWKKVAGVLCESLGEKYGNAVVAGVGINVNTSQKDLEEFSARPFGATSFAIESGSASYDLEEILQFFMKKLFSVYKLYQEQGFQPIQFLWEKNCLLVGKEIELRDAGWKPEDGDKWGRTRGKMLGIDDGGALVLSNARGERRQYVSGEITCYWP